MKNIWLLTVCLSLIGCTVSNQNQQNMLTDPTSFISDNTKKELTHINHVYLGMTQSEVEAVMGDQLHIGYEQTDETTGAFDSIIIPNPHRDELLELSGGTYRVLYYVTHIKKADGIVAEDELTPLVFEDGVVGGKGLGFSFQIKGAVRLKPFSLSPLVPLYDLPRPINWSKEFPSSQPLVVEIGFGMGEVLLRLAKEQPDINYVGIEQHWERIVKTIKRMSVKSSATIDASYANIKILRTDARLAFTRLFDQKSIQRVYCLYPCPWPKKGHIKHRLFSNAFLKTVNSRLVAQGELKIVTDFYPYYQWVLEEVAETGFEVKSGTIKPQFDTKFERKWRSEGQQEFFEIILEKKEHVDVPVLQDVPMKSYYLDTFNPETFSMDKKIALSDQTGDSDATIVFKEFIYDDIKKIGLVYVIVSEEQLMQHLRVAIIKLKDKWQVCKADGQTFFPTIGIAKAIESVYLAAKNL